MKRSENRLNLDTAKIDSQNAEAYRLRTFDPDRALELVNQTLSMAKSIGYRRGEADAIRTLGTLVSHQDREQGLAHAEAAVAIYRSIGDEFGECSALMTVSLYYHHTGAYHRAHLILTEAYEKATRSGNHYVASIALFNLGVNAEDREDFHKASQYYLQAKLCGERSANDTIFWAAEIALASMRFELGERDTDLETLRKAQQSLESARSFVNAIDACSVLAKFTFANGQPRQAMIHLRQAMLLATKHNKPYLKWGIKHRRGVFLFQSGRFISARRALLGAVANAKQTQNRFAESKSLEKLAWVHERLGDSEAAFAALANHVALKKEVFSDESDRRLREVQAMHQVQLVEAESRLLKSKNIELEAINDRLELALREREQLQQELERMATIDELTGVLNRRRILAIGTDFISRFHSQGRQAVVMVIDIDKFKAINDNFGHQVGDEVLRRFTQSCQRVLRPTDYLGRLGGEEFCILLDKTDIEIAKKVAERVLASIRTTRVDDLMHDRGVTASIGMTALRKEHDSVAAALHDADLGLYEAKRSGRDRMCIGRPETPKAA